MLEVDKVIIPL